MKKTVFISIKKFALITTFFEIYHNIKKNKSDQSKLFKLSATFNSPSICRTGKRAEGPIIACYYLTNANLIRKPVMVAMDRQTYAVDRVACWFLFLGRNRTHDKSHIIGAYGLYSKPVEPSWADFAAAAAAADAATETTLSLHH